MPDRNAYLVAWLVLMLLAIPYVRAVKHPDSKLFAAWLVFVLIFSAASFVLFAALSGLAVALGLAPALENVAAAVLLMLLVFLPAFALAHWQARKPPHRPPPID